MKKSFIVVLVIAIAVSMPALTWARPHLNDSSGTDIDSPIDGGLSVLIAAGAGFLAKNRLDKRKQKQQGEQ